MKLLDRYIVKNFLTGYAICLAVMLGMFLTVDLFIHIDEFAEQADRGMAWLAAALGRYYGARCLMWFGSLGGALIVIAAAFSMARMTRNNELIAMMASGVSLKRALAPILFLALLLNGLMIANQEWLIPRWADELTRERDTLAGEKSYDLWFLTDDAGSLICCQEFNEQTGVMSNALIVLRQYQNGVWQTVGRIAAASATYDRQRGGWRLTDATKMLASVPPAASDIQTIDFYPSSLSAEELPLRRQKEFKSLLSLRQLTRLEQNAATRRIELADIAVQKHSRITQPIMNMIMLMMALPALVCRDPKEMKSAIVNSFLTTLACFLAVFICSLWATEPIAGQIRPALFSWLPIFIFFPLSVLRIDAMRT